MAESKVSMRGLKCPLPALKTRKLLARMEAGEVLVIECTDPLTTIDIPNLLRETGDALEGSSKKGKVLTFRIVKGERSVTPPRHSWACPDIRCRLAPRLRGSRSPGTARSRRPVMTRSYHFISVLVAFSLSLRNLR